MAQQDFERFKQEIREWLDSHPEEYDRFVAEVNDKSAIGLYKVFNVGMRLAPKLMHRYRAECHGDLAEERKIQDYAKPSLFREKYDLCVSRAVANLSTLSEYCLPFVKEGGRFISYKSEKTEEEIKEASQAIRLLGGEREDAISFHLPDSDIFRTLIVIRKTAPTPKKYPRKAGLPAKEPIH